MKVLKMFVALIVTAFAMLLIETNKALIHGLGRLNNWMLPHDSRCIQCGTEMEDFRVEEPFCENCISEYNQPEYKPSEENCQGYL
jgi:hypothetical protein